MAVPGAWVPPLRFVTWNVLGDSLLRQNSYLYRRCHPQALHSRMPRVLSGITQLNGDLIALQEVDASQLGWCAAYALTACSHAVTSESRPQ